jgi:hypothetical protein
MMLLVDRLIEELSQKRTRPWKIASEAELKGFVPDPRKCHENARRWVAEREGYMVVEGWIARAVQFFEL